MQKFNTLTSQSYGQFRFDLLKKVEDNDYKPYLDVKKIPTIGIGFNLRVDEVAKEIFPRIGINPTNEDLSPEAKAREKQYQDEIISLINNTYSNKDLLQTALNDVMNRRSADTLLTAIADRRSTFAFRNDDEVKVVFKLLYPYMKPK